MMVESTASSSLEELAPGRLNKQNSGSATKKDINILHAELIHPLEVVVRTTNRVMGLNVAGTFKPCQVCALGKAKRVA